MELEATWVAGRGAAMGATRTIMKECFTPRRVLLQVGLLLFIVLYGIVLLRGEQSPLGAAYLGSAAAFLVMTVSGATRMYATAARGARIRYSAGVAMESAFTDDRMTIRSPLSERTLLYTSVEALRVVDEWVVLKERGVPNASVLPLALFPESARERIRAAGGVHA